MIGSLFNSRTAEASKERFEALMRSSYRQAYRFALRLTGNPMDAEDLLQETYVRAFRFFGRYEESLPFINWLYRIMGNAHIDSFRRKGRIRAMSLDQPAAHATSPLDVADSTATPDRVLLEGTMDGDIETALRNMNAEFRTAVLLADVEGLAYEEIAEIMQTSVGTVRSRIHRGRKQLRVSLAGRAPKEEVLA